MAPNVITLIGFIFTLLHYFLLWYQNPNFSPINKLSPSVLFFSSLFVFLSHFFDGVDGKQARRLKSSSALGELFDHGIDAWTTLFISNSIMSIFGNNLSPIHWIIGQITLGAGFTACHWEKYLTGTLILPWLFDILQIALSAALLIFSMFGYPNFIDNLVVYSFDYLVLGFWLFLMPYYLIRGIIISRRKRPVITRYIYPFIDITIISLLTIYYVRNSGGEILKNNPRWIMFALGTASAHLMTRILVAQLTDERLRIFTPITLTYSFWICAAWLSGHYVAKQYDHMLINQVELIFVKLCCVLVTWMHLSYVVRIINEICETLQIKAFVVNKDKE